MGTPAASLLKKRAVPSALSLKPEPESVFGKRRVSHEAAPQSDNDHGDAAGAGTPHWYSPMRKAFRDSFYDAIFPCEDGGIEVRPQQSIRTLGTAVESVFFARDGDDDDAGGGGGDTGQDSDHAAHQRRLRQDLSAMEATVQKAVVKAAGCIALLAVLVYAVMNLFLPIAKPLIAAVVVSLTTHPSHTRERLDVFCLDYNRRYEHLAGYAPRNPVAAHVYLGVLKVVLSLQVFVLIPRFVAGMLGVSAAVRSAVMVLPLPRALRLEIVKALRRLCSVAALAAFVWFFWGSIWLVAFAAAVAAVGVCCMVAMEVDRAAVVVLALTGLAVGWLASAYVAGNVAVEALHITDYAQDKVFEARSLVNQTATDYNVTDLALHYVVRGVEAAAQSQNVSLAELKELLDTLKGKGSSNGLGDAGRDGGDSWWSLTAAMDPAMLTSVSTLGLGVDAWLDVSKHVGSTAVWVSNVTVKVLNVLLMALFALIDVFWALVYFVFFLYAFNTTPHTLPFYVLRAVLSDPSQAKRLDQQVSRHLTSLLMGFLNLYIYHFALTFATLSRFGFEFPYIGATLAGFFALFPYVPKYFFLPLFLLPRAISSYDDAPHTLYELLLWMVVPFLLGDEWLFDDVAIAQSRWMILGAVLGWTNWGGIGVFLGPIVVVLIGSIATIVQPQKQNSPTEVRTAPSNGRGRAAGPRRRERHGKKKVA